jgi:hypothetical protein
MNFSPTYIFECEVEFQLEVRENQVAIFFPIQFLGPQDKNIWFSGI